MAASLLAWLLPSAFPLVLSIALMPRLTRFGSAASGRLYLSLGLGVGAGLVCVLVESYFTHLSGIDPRSQSLGDWASLTALLAFFAPVEEALKLAAFLPAYRLRWIRGRRGALAHATALALGYAAIDTAHYLLGVSVGPLPLARALLALPAHVFAAGVWAYVLGGQDEQGSSSPRAFLLIWLAATILHGLYDHLLFGRGLATIFATLPLLAAMTAVGYLAVRPLMAAAPASLRALDRLPPPPSMRAVRAALRRAERPATLRWIAFGSLVTAGVMIASIALTIVVAHRMGIDFSAVDEGEVTSTVPLVMLGTAILAAFPLAGFLVARASDTGTVLEPAMSAAVTIAGTLVLLGLAAPVAVVFGFAFAPVAFVLACGGAWVGCS